MIAATEFNLDAALINIRSSSSLSPSNYVQFWNNALILKSILFLIWNIRASPADYLSLSSIPKACPFGNERCSSRLSIPLPIPNFFWQSPKHTPPSFSNVGSSFLYPIFWVICYSTYYKKYKKYQGMRDKKSTGDALTAAVNHVLAAHHHPLCFPCLRLPPGYLNRAPVRVGIKFGGWHGF